MEDINDHYLALTTPVSSEGEKITASFSAQQSAQPQIMAPMLVHILREVQREMGYERSQVSEWEDTKAEQLIDNVSERLGIELNAHERDLLLARLEDEEKSFGVLQSLVDDVTVSDIIVTNYAKIAVQQGRATVATDLAFASQEAYEAFVERLLHRASTTYSTKKPIADGMLGVFARLHVVHSALCESGPYLTIRLNRFGSVTTADLIRSGIAPAAVMQYLEALVQGGVTLLVVGEVGTGKTTLTRALAACIPHDQSILVIEDTPEIRLEHPNVRYLSTREANSDGAGRVTPQECIRGGMRMAMNRIIFGEMRDAEAAEAFVDVCASGHPGLSTIHGRSANEAISRLELFLGRAQRGVARAVLSEQVVTAVQVVVHLGICPLSGKRRIMEVKEIGPVADGVIRQREIFRYHPENDFPAWRVVNRLSAHRQILDERGVLLSSLSSSLELDPEILYRESMGSLNICN